MKKLVCMCAAAISFAALLGPGAARAASDPAALFARERVASGGDAWRAVAAVRTLGWVVQAGVPNPFSQLVDRKTGWSKTSTDVGSLHDISGFDGVAWDFEGGPVTEQTLPGMQADNVTQAYVARDGWWNRNDPARMTPLADRGVRVTPRGGSPIDVWFDARTGLIARTISHTDFGAVTEVLDDYRTVGNVVVSFHQVSHDPTNTETVVNVRSIELLASVAAGAYARPQPVSAGRIAGGGASAVAPFQLSGLPGAIVADVRVGARAATVIFDSGAANYFTPAGARALGLHGAGGLELGGVGSGSENGSIAALKSIALGNAVLRDQHTVIGPLPYALVREGKFLVSGLVGAEFLEAFRTAFDFDRRRATFTPFERPFAAPKNAAVLPVLSDGQHAYVQASIDGVPGIYLLDTGNSGDIVVNRTFAKAHGLFVKPGVRYLSIGGIGGHVAYDRYRAASLTLGGATMKFPPVTVPDVTAGSFASRSVAGNLGLRIIARYNIVFDFRHATVSLVPNARFNQPFLVDRSGFSLNQTSAAAFVVLSVVTGSPADQAGLKVGESITAFNGRNIAARSLTLNDLQPLQYGTRPFTLTIQAADKSERTVTVRPRDIIPPRP